MYFDISDRSKKYICLQKDPTSLKDRTSSLMTFGIPGICFLVPSPSEIKKISR